MTNIRAAGASLLPANSLKRQVAAWFTGLILVLYGLASLLLLTLYRSDGRADIALLLYNQAESLASYLAATDRLDYPELQALEPADNPVWLRILSDGQIISSTPGLPPFKAKGSADTPEGRYEVYRIEGRNLALVREDVWNKEGWIVEAVTALGPMESRNRTLALGLLVVGLILIPVAASGGWLLSARALRPVDNLVRAIGELDPETLSRRLEPVAGVSEVHELTQAFNGLLGRLEKSLERMERFTADASHELRTPVTILKTGIEVALRRPRTEDEYREILTDSLTEIQRLQRIVDGLLALAGRGAPAGKIEMGPTPLTDVAHRALREISRLAAEKDLRIEEDVAPGCEIDGNADLLQLLFLNLLDNAVRHTPPGKGVRLALSPDASGKEVVLTVADQGPGVPEADRPFVFDRFFRGSKSLPNALPSGGLGLSVVRWVAETHKGTVVLKDSSEGACFEVRLPRSLSE